VEGVYNRIDQRVALLDAVKEKNLYKICIWLDIPINKCLHRERAYRKRPEIIVKHQANRLEPPTYEEGWDEIRHIVWTAKKE
jgi:predicted kinase